jgi:putative endonuclease
LYYLLYFEEIQSIQLAIAREKQLKRWHREWKINLIKTINPELKDLMEK